MKPSKWFKVCAHLWVLNGILIFGICMMGYPDPFLVAAGVASCLFGCYGLFQSIKLEEIE